MCPLNENPPDGSEKHPTFWPKLYKTTSKGAEQEWSIHVVPYEAGPLGPGEVWADIVVKHGQVDGKIQTAVVQVSKGKNVGKKNATTPVQQALAEAEAKWKKQLDKGYSETRGGGSMELKPMLAHKYEDRKKKVVFPAYVQPKLDGVRCLAVRNGDSIVLLSRQGKEHKGLGHIRSALLCVMKDGDVWDGELYVHGMPFQKLVSLVKKDQPESRNVEYHVYDTVGDTYFWDRYWQAARAIKAGNVQHSSAHLACLRVVPTHGALSHEQVEDLHEETVANGYEGVMLRWGAEPYKSGYRSEHLLKVKAFEDAEFEIVDVVPGVGKEADKGTFVCKTEAGAAFSCRPRGRDELRADYLTNKEKYIGKMLTVRYFEMTTSETPVPRFPVGVSVRDYE